MKPKGKLHMIDWMKYNPLSKEEMASLYKQGKSAYEIAAISCPPEYNWSQWMKHYFTVVKYLSTIINNSSN